MGKSKKMKETPPRRTDSVQRAETLGLDVEARKPSTVKKVSKKTEVQVKKADSHPLRPKQVKKIKKSKTKKVRVNRAATVDEVKPLIEAEILHEPCGEGEAVAQVHVSAPKSKKKTYADGLQVNWEVHIGDAIHPYHSVRAMSVGLKQMGHNIGNTEKMRAFIRRRRLGTACKSKSYSMFDGIDHVYRVGSDVDLLAGRPPPTSDSTESDSSSSSSSDSEMSSDDK